MQHAARLGDHHGCPNVTGGPHQGGPIDGPCWPSVLIGGKPAARFSDRAWCHPFGVSDAVAQGWPTVLIGNQMAARQGDLMAHGGVISEGCDTVRIGGAWGAQAPPSTDSEAIAQALAIIEHSKFGNTAEGKKILRKLKELNRKGKIKFENFSGNTLADFNPKSKDISISSQFSRDPEAVASRLTHEGTHAVEEDDYPASKGNSIDEEIRCRTNQLDLYEDQKARGYHEPNLDRQERDRQNSDEKLRDRVRGLYPADPEHRQDKSGNTLSPTP